MPQNPAPQSVVLALLARHNLPLAEPRLSPGQGIVNQVWLCGEWVVRLCAAEDDDLRRDCWTESVAAPIAFAAGIRTPEPIAFDFSGEIHPAPASIFRLAAGARLSEAASLNDPEAFYLGYGRQLKALHSIQMVEDPDGWLDEAWEEEENALPLVFSHQDLHAENVLVAPSGMPVFLDWGDAGFSSGACDFRYVPGRYLKSVLEGYGRITAPLARQIALHLLAQQSYAEEMGRDYGPFGQSTPAELQAAIDHLRSL